MVETWFNHFSTNFICQQRPLQSLMMERNKKVRLGKIVLKSRFTLDVFVFFINFALECVMRAMGLAKFNRMRMCLCV